MKAGLLFGLFLACVPGEVCEIGFNIYATSDEYGYTEGCYEYPLVERDSDFSEYIHYGHSTAYNEMMILVISVEEGGNDTARFRDDNLLCTTPDYSGGVVSGEAVFEPCFNLETSKRSRDRVFPSHSRAVANFPVKLEFCNFQLSGGDDHLRDTASGFYTGDIDGCYYAADDLNGRRHTMIDGEFPLQYVLDRGDDPGGVSSYGDPVSPTLVKAYKDLPGDYVTEEFDLSVFTWVFDLVGEYPGYLSTYDDDLVDIYEYYAMWSPEEKDNPEEIESWFAMRRDEEGEVFLEDISNLVSFKCGCSGDDVDDNNIDNDDVSVGELTSESVGIAGMWAAISVGIVTILLNI